MVDLSRAGLVQGTRGSGGGVRLAADPAKVTVRRIVDAIEGPMALYTCLEDGGVCKREAICQMRHVWGWAQSRFLMALEDFTLNDLMTGEIPQQVGRLRRDGPGRVTVKSDDIQVVSGQAQH